MNEKIILRKLFFIYLKLFINDFYVFMLKKIKIIGKINISF